MNNLRRVALLTIPLLLAGALAGEANEPPPDLPLALAVRRVRVVRDAESIVVAQVTRVHESPGIWCGTAVTHQDVTYRILETVAGKSIEGPVRVGHLLVAGSVLVSKDAPFLKPTVFQEGARFLLCLNSGDGDWVVMDETFGATPIDPPRKPDGVHATLLRQLLLHPEFAAYVHPEQDGRVPLKVALSKAFPVAAHLPAFGQPVGFLPLYLLRNVPHVAVQEIRVEDKRATVRFTYDVEGVRGEAHFALKGDRYDLESLTLTER